MLVQLCLVWVKDKAVSRVSPSSCIEITEHLLPQPRIPAKDQSYVVINVKSLDEGA